MAKAISLFLVWMFALSSPVVAQENGSKAWDAVKFFEMLCVRTSGNRASVENLLAGKPLATPLPAQQVLELHGAEGGLAWVVRSPRNARLLLDFDPSGTCGVRVAEAEKTKIIEAFDTIASRLPTANGSAFEINKGEKLNDMPGLLFKEYNIFMNGRAANIALTAGDKPMHTQQHFMSFVAIESGI